MTYGPCVAYWMVLSAESKAAGYCEALMGRRDVAVYPEYVAEYLEPGWWMEPLVVTGERYDEMVRP